MAQELADDNYQPNINQGGTHMSRAQGQFTIIDYNDALTLTGFIGSSLAKTQMFNPDNNTYNPNWASTNLVLTPSLCHWHDHR